jgi:hypothetical protein
MVVPNNGDASQTNPEAVAGQAEEQTTEQSGSQSGTPDVQGDGWVQSVTQRLDTLETNTTQRFEGIGKDIREGFAWLRERLPATEQQTEPNQSSQPDAVQESALELTVQDREAPAVKQTGARTTVNLGTVFRKLFT